MKQNITSLFIALACVASPPSLLAEVPQPPHESQTAQLFEPFTGKILKNKVRLRLQANLDGPVLRELNRDQLVIILGETDEFYAIKPLPDMKAYIFRTYVLDNVIEGTRVNVRLHPDLDAPVIAQLNSGYRVNGEIYPANTKWLQIQIPDPNRFYIAKEYIQKVGDADHLTRIEKRKEDVHHLLQTTKAVSDTEMQKPFNQINLDGIVANYKRIILDYKDFPEEGIKADEFLKALQEAYTEKKIAFLEQQAQLNSSSLEKKNKELIDEVNAQKRKLSQLEQRVHKESSGEPIAAQQRPVEASQRKSLSQLPYHMTAWLPAEEALFKEWSTQTGNDNPTAFYQDQKQQAFTIRGTIDRYSRPVKNKPGDFMLLNTSSKLPMAFLYSTQINLHDYIGHEVNLLVIPRPNYNYAFPAYFVLTLEH